MAVAIAEFTEQHHHAIVQHRETDTSAVLRAKDAVNASVLDYVRAESEALSARLGTADRAKLDQYLTGVRELERSSQHVPTEPTDPLACALGAAPQAGKPGDIQEHVKLMLDINALAIICGVTRVSLFDYEHTTTERNHSFLGVNVGYHSSVTHHAGNATALDNYALINQWLVSQFVYLAQKLDAVSEGSGHQPLPRSHRIYDQTFHDSTLDGQSLTSLGPTLVPGRHGSCGGITILGDLYRWCARGTRGWREASSALSHSCRLQYDGLGAVG